MQITAHFETDIGRKRQQNQDHGICLASKGLFLVADGMGGHRGGEIASQMAVALIGEGISETSENTPTLSSRRTELERAIATASRRIYEHASQNPSLHGMGTTVTAALLSHGTAHIGQVGDSRCYLYRAKHLWQLTRDHSWIQERLRAGIISPEQAESEMATARNVITRSVGFEPKVEPEIYELPLIPGDALLLCSDGLTSLVQHQEILEELHHLHSSPPEALERISKNLILRANEAGGDDNVSVLLIHITA